MFNITFLIGIALAGFAAQFIDGTLGMGYGVSSTSLLMAIGLAPAIASASVHTAEIVTTLVSGIAHHQLGNVKMSKGSGSFPWSFPASLAGRWEPISCPRSPARRSSPGWPGSC